MKANSWKLEVPTNLRTASKQQLRMKRLSTTQRPIKSRLKVEANRSERRRKMATPLPKRPITPMLNSATHSNHQEAELYSAISCSLPSSVQFKLSIITWKKKIIFEKDKPSGAYEVTIELRILQNIFVSLELNSEMLFEIEGASPTCSNDGIQWGTRTPPL